MSKILEFPSIKVNMKVRIGEKIQEEAKFFLVLNFKRNLTSGSLQKIE